MSQLILAITPWAGVFIKSTGPLSFAVLKCHERRIQLLCSNGNFHNLHIFEKEGKSLSALAASPAAASLGAENDGRRWIESQYGRGVPVAGLKK